jgi:transposase
MSSAFELQKPETAGVDLGSRTHLVAAPVRSGGEVRSFGCFTRDLVSMGEWLLSLGTRYVAMEATGVYWVPVYEALEAMGLQVALVDGRAAKALPGRKSDVQDCQWIRDLYSHGLVRPCMVPEGEVLALRSYWRPRTRLVQQRSEQIQLMQKALEQMNVQIHKVLSDLSGASGLAIVRAIVAGERKPSVLADLCHRVKASRERIELSLEGTWSEHHLFALAQALETYDFFTERAIECERRIDKAIARLSGKEPSGPKRGKPYKSGLSFSATEGIASALGVDPTSIDGIDERTAITLLSEFGSDLSRFKTEKHFVSYLRLSPQNAITGGKLKKGQRRQPSTNRASTALKLAAQSLARTETALGACYRRLKTRIGASKAKTAVARKIAIHYYRLLVYGILYDDPGAQRYDEIFREKRLRYLTKQATRLGLTLLPSTAPEVVA